MSALFPWVQAGFLLSNRSHMFGRGNVTAFKALGTETNGKLGWVRLTAEAENREILQQKAVSILSSTFCFEIEKHEMFVLDSCGKIPEREIVKPLCFFHVLPLVLRHLCLYPVCLVLS